MRKSIELTCVVCGKPFMATRKDAKTDGGRCRSRLDKWRHDNIKQARAAMRAAFTLRCAVIRGLDPRAASMLVELEQAVQIELAYLSNRGIPVPVPLDLADLDTKPKDCQNAYGSLK